MSTLENYLHLLQKKPHLTREEAKNAMAHIMQGADPYQTAAFLSVLKFRGESAEEIAGMQEAVEDQALHVDLSFPVLDIVGTGGDGSHTVNISTGSAILAAACGIPVVKHGNRSVSSRCGSADVLEALGIAIEMPPKDVVFSLQEAHIAFLYAPYYHPCLKKLRRLRSALKIPTIFNLLGPLLNPARAPFALIGVADLSLLETMANSIVQLKKIKRALVFHGSGLDELSPLGPIVAYDVRDGTIERMEIDPQKLGFKSCALTDLQGGDAEKNAFLLSEAFSGKSGAIADALILNAGAALWIFERASSLEEGIAIARSALKEGKALAVLEKWKKCAPQRKKENYLDRILTKKREHVEQLLQNKDHRFAHALKQPHLAVIAEIKRRSPSRGKLHAIEDPVLLALEYCKGGASAISVLTDEHFEGTLEDLKRVAQALATAYPHVPILRKDFIVHPMQLLESKIAGASAVLLIANVLGNDLKSFILEAERLGLETLTEVHDAEDLALAIEAGAPIIGINHRNLSTFEIDLSSSPVLRPLIPSSIVAVAESGIVTAQDAYAMHALHYDAILVGEALVTSADPKQLIMQMQGVNHAS
jgi:anthranilate phosphoribosyltransferase